MLRLLFLSFLLSAFSAAQTRPERPVTLAAVEAPTTLVQPLQTPLTKSAKFGRFVTSNLDAGNVLSAAAEAGLSQTDHGNLGFGQGADGFGKRFGASLADRASFSFFSQFALPVALKQDPRYRRRIQGRFVSRLFYAGSRAFVGRTDFGTSTFNTPIVAGAFLSSAIANAYYPERERTLAFTLRSGGLNIGSAIGANLGREFWPDIKKLLLRK